jgi:hypothetical protein
MRHWNEIAYANEVPVLKSLEDKDMEQQADVDVDLHRHGRGRYGSQGDQFLSKDAAHKQAFKDVISGREADDSVIADTISQLEFDRKLHVAYLARGPQPYTGSDDWHRRWVGIYDGWLKALRKIQRNKHGP